MLHGLRWIALLLAFAGAGAAAEIPLADFARHASYENVKISPRGDYLAAAAMVKGKRVLSLIRLADMKGVNVDAHDPDEVADFWWIEDHRIVYSIQERFEYLDVPLRTGELYAANADGSGRAIVAGSRDFGGFRGIADVLGKIPGDDKHLLVATTPWARESENLFTSAQLMDGSGSMQRLATAPMRGAGFVADNHGEVRFAYADDGDMRLKVFYRSVEHPEWELLFDPAKGDGPVRPLRFARDDASVYFACAGERKTGGICRWDVAGRTMRTVWSGESEATDLLDTYDGRDAFAIRSMPGRPALTLLDAHAPEAALMRELMQQFPGQDVSVGSHTTDAAKAVIRVSGDRNPGEFYLYDGGKKKLTFLLAERPWIKPERLVPVEPVALTARDGLPLHGYLARPQTDAQKPGPLVVYVHGGPFGIRDSWEYDPMVQMLASRGYAVLQVNFRGSGGYGTAFLEAGLRQWGESMQDDVTDATRWAIGQKVADPGRICIFGASYGGYAALEGAEKEPDLYRCAVGYVGVYDLRMMLKRGDIPQSTFGRNYLKRALGDDADALFEHSPVAHPERIKAAVMLVVGGSDGRVPEEQGKSLHAALGAHGIDHEWIYERHEAHGFYKEEHVTELYAKLLAFLDRSIGEQRQVPKS
jgi:dipeptidyl aminopeptidase/acylaminoacyl peptidase